MWMMDSAIIHREFQKDGFPQLCEQGDNHLADQMI